MSLLAELATRISDLRRETTGTEALGVLLRRPETASALMRAVQQGAPSVPVEVEFSTQVASADGRPDVVARDEQREVVLIEGKYWFGFTPAQEMGTYLDRLHRAWQSSAPDDPHVGALVFVVPNRRVLEVKDKVGGFYALSDWRGIGDWHFADAPNGVVVAVCSWQQLLASLMATGTEDVIADCRQLLGLVDDVDRHAFVPWSEAQVGDRDTAQRIFQLVGLVESVRSRALRDGVATHAGGRQTSKRHDLSYGKILTLGGVQAILVVSPYLWAEHGETPIWLRFRAGAGLAREALGNVCRKTSDGVAVPVPIPTNQTEDDAVAGMVLSLAEAASKLEEARRRRATPPVVDDFDEADDL
ncbi:hypothetical protein [Modestobacter versicolor]|uniref:Uncharacterized protein n=1 Tax=Modestobacter versicolor TaxID=429133 RepID=A0A323VWC3_9ACTN|nr:hypothetical protein [Modestobacter versicolor]MBB3674371.1 hypothetical protein [Modestobacter versicolor]PZA23088.1 hypothetical protein DMO24_01580 [Modestobacter versicolor]